MSGETAIIKDKGQVVIPVRLREKLGLTKGTIVVFIEEDGRLILQPMTRDVINRLIGDVKNKGSKKAR